MKSEQTEQNAKINCFNCKFFYITWDPNFPRGCRSYGIKTSELPSAAVQRASGKPCQAYTEK